MALSLLARNLRGGGGVLGRCAAVGARTLSSSGPGWTESIGTSTVMIYGRDVPLKEVSALTLADDRIELEPYDPTTSAEIRASLAVSLEGTGSKVYFDSGSGRLVVTARAYATDSQGATKAKTKPVVRVAVDEDLVGDARDLDDLGETLRATQGRWVMRAVKNKPNKRDGAAKQLVDEAGHDYRTSRRVTSRSKKALRQVARRIEVVEP